MRYVAVVRLPKPTPEAVRKQVEVFDSRPETKLNLEVMRQLKEKFPSNRELSHVLLKVVVLDNLFSTRVKNKDQETLARHIVSLKIDGPIIEGDLDAVESIANCKGLPNHFSFSSKFCSWHNPEEFPMYDGNVDEALWAYRNEGKARLEPFRRTDMYSYSKFARIISLFRERNGLQKFTLRQIDKFLWQIGDRILKRKEELKAAERQNRE